jgi:O-antigen/teichoic acid export membrane protein
MNVRTYFKTTLAGRPDLQAFTRNSGWLIGDKLMKLCVAVFVGAWVARFLGPAQYGQLSYAIAFISIFQAVSVLGMDSILVKHVASAQYDPGQILGTALRLRWVGALLAYLTLVVTVTVFLDDDPKLHAITLIVGLIMFFQTSDVIDLWFQGNSQSKRTVIAKTASYVITAGLKVVLILVGAKLVVFALAQVVEAALSAAALYLSYRLYKASSKWQWDWTLAREILSQSLPILVSGLSILVYMRVGIIFLQEIKGSAEVGIYTAGAALSEVWYFIPMTLVTSAAPIIAKKKLNNEASYNAALLNLFAVMWYFALTVSLVNFIIARPLMQVLYGARYADSSTVLSIHAFTLVAVSVGVVQSLWIINEGKTKISVYQAATGAVCSIVANFFLVPRYGAAGAAASTVLAQFAQAFLINFIVAPKLFKMQLSSLFMFVRRRKQLSSGG